MKSLHCTKVLLLAIVAAVVGTLTIDGLGNRVDAQHHWPRDFQNLGDSFFEIGAKAYDRPGDSLGVPVLVNSQTNAVLLNSGNFTDLGGGAGAEVRFGSKNRRGQKWEVRTFLTNWSDDFNFDQPNLSSPLSPMLDPDSVDIGYDSEIFSIELNVRKPITSGVTFITGPRLISLVENLSFDSETNIPTPPLGSFDLFTENSIGTRNLLLGGQIGALVNVPISRDIYIQGFIRTGGYLNFVELRTEADSSIIDEQINIFRRNSASFVGEVGGKVYVDLIPGLFSGFLGYEATWIDNVALAPVQANSLTPNTIVTKVTPFFHAVTFGFQFRR